jgi:hypothetical protein
MHWLTRCGYVPSLPSATHLDLGPDTDVRLLLGVIGRQVSREGPGAGSVSKLRCSVPCPGAKSVGGHWNDLIVPVFTRTRVTSFPIYLACTIHGHGEKR